MRRIVCRLLGHDWVEKDAAGNGHGVGVPRPERPREMCRRCGATRPHDPTPGPSDERG